MANKAAFEEQLEIDLEQQALKVVNQTPGIVKIPAASQTSTKKTQQKVSINIMDFVKTKTSPVKVSLCRVYVFKYISLLVLAY